MKFNSKKPGTLIIVLIASSEAGALIAGIYYCLSMTVNAIV